MNQILHSCVVDMPTFLLCVDVTQILRICSWKMTDVSVLEAVPANWKISADVVNNGKSMDLSFF